MAAFATGSTGRRRVRRRGRRAAAVAGLDLRRLPRSGDPIGARASLLQRAPRVEPITTADYPTPARRPAYSVLATDRLRADFGIQPPPWREGLREVIAQLSG